MIQKSSHIVWLTGDVENRKLVDYLPLQRVLSCGVFELENVLLLLMIDALLAAPFTCPCWFGGASGCDDATHCQLSSPRRTCRLITVFIFLFSADNRPIKRFHTTEDTGRIPRCVSISEPDDICLLCVCKINTGWSTLVGRIIWCDF